jgi:hydroxymethylpyrimidine/phosphomethylpyrimidine kinase
MELAAAVQRAKSYLTAALIASDKLDVGSGEGHGPVHHFHGLWG